MAVVQYKLIAISNKARDLLVCRLVKALLVHLIFKLRASRRERSCNIFGSSSDISFTLARYRSTRERSSAA